jgi:hypothetical protein
MISRALIAAVLLLAVASPAPGQEAAPAATGPSIAGVLRGSLGLLAVEHGVRLALQPKTRRELGGPFWADYRRSVNLPDSWEDGDGWLVNYIGHPIHGAAAGVVRVVHAARCSVLGSCSVRSSAFRRR